jgi:hypothetical protein
VKVKGEVVVQVVVVVGWRGRGKRREEGKRGDIY